MLSMWRRIELREDGQIEAWIVLILTIDVRFVTGEELTQLVIGATHQWKVLIDL